MVVIVIMIMDDILLQARICRREGYCVLGKGLDLVYTLLIPCLRLKGNDDGVDDGCYSSPGQDL